MVKSFKVFGERHCGTNAVTFFTARNSGLKYNHFHMGWKHRIAPNPREHQKYSENTLFVFCFRNPYSWIKSMHKRSYEEHKMSIYMRKLSFDDFLRYPFLDFENIITTWNIKNNSYVRMAREVPYSIKINIEDFNQTQKEINKKLNKITNKNLPLFNFDQYINGSGLKKDAVFDHKGEIERSLSVPELTKDQINYINKFLNKDLLHGLGYDLL